jgi:Amt family ammonium transporter
MAVLVWCLIEALHKGKATSLGAASGAVAGLVAITPACGFVDVKGALWIGAIVSVLCYLAIQVKIKMGYDDSLDVFGIHGVGGAWGAIATGIWAINGKGALYGNPGQLMIQIKTVALTGVYCIVVTAIIYFIVNAVVGMKASAKDEELGLDLSQHGEEGYSH